MTSASTEALPPIRFLWGTALLMALNVGLFVALLSQQETWAWTADLGTLLHFGAKQNGLIAQGDWLRLIMPAFLNSHPLQLSLNLLFLCYAAYTIEVSHHALVLLVVYLVSGFSGALLSTTCVPSVAMTPWLPHAFIGTTSTAAVLGLIAFLSSEFFFNIYHLQYPLERRLVVGHILLLVLFFALPSVVPYLDVAALLGGLLAGLWLGLSAAGQQIWSLKRQRALPYLHSGHFPSPPYSLRESFWLTQLGAFMLLASAGIFFMPTYEKRIAAGVELYLNRPSYNRPTAEFMDLQKYLTSQATALRPQEITEHIAFFTDSGAQECAAALQDILKGIHKAKWPIGANREQSRPAPTRTLSVRRDELQNLAVMTETLGFPGISFYLWRCLASLDRSETPIHELIACGLASKKYQELQGAILPPLLKGLE